MEKEKIIDSCHGCIKIDPNLFCAAYPKPAMWWKNGKQCPLATHIERGGVEKVEKVRIGQQKQKRKGRK